MLIPDSSHPMKIEMFKFISWKFLFAIMSYLFSFPEKPVIYYSCTALEKV